MERLSFDEEPARVGLGVLGCGGFGLYALQNFVQVEGVELVAMAATHRSAAVAAAKRLGLADVGEQDDLLKDSDVDLVYIATPPFLHFEQAMAALTAGKHVICEKPLALTVEEADQLLAVARERDLLMVTNLMQRYNPVFNQVRRLIEDATLGKFLHGQFENYASDEYLPADHWFWNTAKSGGIFVEHGVHFFDLFTGWLGPGEVTASAAGIRPKTGVEEQVECFVRYADGTWVTFYHGFHQAQRMDRQVMKLIFEHGDVTLLDWIPTRVRIHALVDEQQNRHLAELFPTAVLDITAMYGPSDRVHHSRHQSVDAFQMIELADGDQDLKQHRYGRMLRAMMTDQVAWIHDRTHRRVITETNGRDSLAVACEANRLAHVNAASVPAGAAPLS